jgi:hypothetical protein
MTARGSAPSHFSSSLTKTFQRLADETLRLLEKKHDWHLILSGAKNLTYEACGTHPEKCDPIIL